MAANGEPPSSSSSSPFKSSSSTAPPPSRPTITLPPRPFPEAFFNGGPGSGGMGVGFSPGPMTLVSNFFSDSDDFKSFSQLLAGAMASPGAIPPPRLNFQPSEMTSAGDSSSGDGDFQFKLSRGHGLTIAPPPAMFALPTGLSPATLLDSPGFGLFSPSQGPFGMTHQQALAQVTAQAAQAQSHLHAQPENTSSFSAATSLTQFSSFCENPPNQQQIAPIAPDSRVTTKESSDLSQSDQRSQTCSVAVDKPADDGYNWRKYGQKQVKGSEFPRSYYKCTYSNCPVKKKVERSLDGQVTEIIYKGQHNHEPPQHNKRSKDSGSFNGSANKQGDSELPSKFQSENVNKMNDGVPTYVMSGKDQESSQATPGHQSGTSDSEEVDDTETGANENDKDEPDPKRRNTEVRISSSHRTVTEPRIIVQTTSEVDLLDDGYRWRKYGQKVVKGNPYPRSYYKCTTQGCNVRKHVERAASDPKAVVTTYEGKHIHDVPAAKSSSHNTANSNAYQLKPQDQVQERRALFKKAGSTNGNKQPIARLRLKEEQIT
ncbi:hypothetical protein HS088_TW07G01032 [Tripterygium wilfordii]|uniref:WRKY domain-containing protein n=1 Tax=Tripterygium wilfordii TaxID=458696 RepID=A0A7J7DGP1_TRIWF|nr:probable WRKY transcription factor 3 [Tripterygium wilfordii]KAF5745448.1 hypothetical protein HS088_TW07G01032 [Tripterygium wilfordii]